MPADLFIPPAAEGLPLAALDSATAGASALDAFARTPQGRNLLAHALVQLARDGWLRTEPGEGFETVRDRETPEAADEPAPAVSSPLPDQTLRDRLVAAIKASPFDELRTVDYAPNGPLLIKVKVDDLADTLMRHLPAVLPPPADRATVLLEAAEVSARFVSDCQTCAVELEVARELRRLAAEAPKGSEVERLQEQLEESENTAEQLVRNVQTVARERESYRKAWKAEQQRRAKTVAEVRKVAEGLEGDAAAPGVVEIVRPALRDAARQIRAALDGAEARQPDTRPRRGDQFEAWLKAQRDAFGWQGANRRDMFDAFDNLLDLYRLHADTGTPLGGHVCEGQAVGDCECLEPAADGTGEEPQS